MVGPHMKKKWKQVGNNPLFAFEANDQFAKFHLIFATKSPPAELFHYTPSGSLIPIINSQCMFATERHFLNDPQEFQWGLTAFREQLSTTTRHLYSAEFIKQIKSALRDDTYQDAMPLFVISFSANPDLLSQWRAYADDGKGFAIGFDGSVLRDRSGFSEFTLRDIDLEKMPNEFLFCYHLLPVIYEESDQVLALRAFFDAAHASWLSDDDKDDPTSQKVFRWMVQHRVREFPNPRLRANGGT